MTAQRGLSHINLLPKDSFEFSGVGKVLKWTTTVGRILVVMTEFVVILAFASRFYFDKKLNDLSDTIDAKIEVIKGYSDVETQTRDVLSRQVYISNYLSKKIDTSKKITDFAKIMPLSVKIDTLEITGKEMNVSAVAGSETAFAQLLLSLKKNPDLRRLSLNSTTYDQSSGSVRFSFKVTYK